MTEQTTETFTVGKYIITNVFTHNAESKEADLAVLAEDVSALLTRISTERNREKR